MKRLARIASPILQPRRGYVGPARASAFLGLGQTFPPLLPPPRLRLYSQHSTSSKICPSCGSGLDLAEISCTKCSSLCPLPEDINYLSLFGFHSQPPFEFDLDASKLRREYLRMMSKVHPDSVIDKSEDQIRIAGNVSSTITHAYSTLQKPLSRATYLLHRLDPPVPVTESSKLSDPELLTTVLEVREAIEEATSHSEIAAIKAENDERIKDVRIELGKAFRTGHAYDARDRTIELRYWEGLRRACDDWEPGKRVQLTHE